MAKFKINEGNVENFFCCTTIFDRICEGVVDEHMLGFVLSGELHCRRKKRKSIFVMGKLYSSVVIIL